MTDPHRKLEGRLHLMPLHEMLLVMAQSAANAKVEVSTGGGTWRLTLWDGVLVQLVDPTHVDGDVALDDASMIATLLSLMTKREGTFSCQVSHGPPALELVGITFLPGVDLLRLIDDVADVLVAPPPGVQ